jgi:hypothetical protein
MSVQYRPPNWWPYQSEFPDWRLWQGDNKLFYARLPGTSPLVIVRAADVTGLRDEIISAESRSSPEGDERYR